MTEPEAQPPVEPDVRPATLPEVAASSGAEPPSRLRRFFLRHLPLSIATAALLLAAALLGLYIWTSSSGFENMVRRRLEGRIQSATGGRVEIASFHWRVTSLEADAGGVVLHGSEAPGEVPYARVERLRVGFSLLGLWSPRILLRDLVAYRPSIHFIVYPDGSTNQPHPGRPQKPALATLFDLKAGHVAIQQAAIDYENRAASFDFQNRYTLLDFQANDASLRMTYLPAQPGHAETFRVEAAAADLGLSRGERKSGAPAIPPVQGSFQAALDLERNNATLRSLTITAHGVGLAGQTHALLLSGSLINFAQPQWQARVTGDLDMRLLNPVFGYPFAPEGIARLDLAAAGYAGQFRTDGAVHIDNGSYIGTGVIATGVGFDAQIHADPERLLVTGIIARLRQGGQLEGEVALSHWLPPIAGSAVLRPTTHSTTHPAKAKLAAPPIHSPPVTVPVIGKVTATLTDVSLDTLLDMVGQAPFQRLGLDALLNGSALANWTDGDDRTLAVAATLALSPSAHGVPGEVPSSGAIDGIYTQRDGAVDLRTLQLRTPASQIVASGRLGAYPLSSPSALALDVRTRNLWEFDTVLRDLGLTRNGKLGLAALPVSLAGEATFHGAWNGSLVDPHLAGIAKASQFTIDFPPSANSTQPQPLCLDSVEATGTYTALRIDLSHARLTRGQAAVDLDGSLIAAAPVLSSGATPIPSFDANSLLRLHLRAGKADLNDILPLTGLKPPLTGVLNAQFDLSGPLHNLDGSGWFELDGGSVYGEPVSRIRAQGTVAGQLFKLASVTVNDQAGKILGSGAYDLNSSRFQLDFQSTGFDLSRLQALSSRGLAVTGKLGFSIAGSGTFDDPRLEARASIAGLTLGGEPLGGLDFVARTANRLATYDVTTRLEAAALTLHGQTALGADNQTQAKLEFSRFNIGALLKQAHISGLNGESALAGAVTVEGPLALPDKLRGEARLDQLELTVAGVHLRSEGGLHATLANARVTLDPLHITGEETDLRAQGNLALNGSHQLDFASSGAINLKVAQTIDPDLTAGGNSTFEVEAHGTLQNPGLTGRIEFQNAALSLEDIPNGLSQLHGSLEFNQNRLEVRSLTAMSGGGLLSVAGYLAYQNGLFADLTVTGNQIRIRYPQGVSSLADATLRLQGPQNNLLLSGNVLITRFTMNPDFDITALAAQASTASAIAPLEAPSNHVRLDVHVASSPQLNFQNAYAKLAGDVDLRLRGTLASPSLLGRVSITEGSAMIAGTRYELQHGEISFTNPVRIQPSIDLNATARVEEYDITLGMHGTFEKPTVTYRSDPPLPEADVVALLALGRTENQERIYTQQQEQSGANPTTDALLGGALNATVSSRVQKLFGAGSVKVDPNYIGALGNATSRIIVEEQLGSNVTLTYATNVNSTAQQLIQAEIAVNHHLSLQVARDESGVFSMVFKATRRFR